LPLLLSEHQLAAFRRRLLLAGAFVLSILEATGDLL
jgi:hypothetical protein